MPNDIDEARAESAKSTKVLAQLATALAKSSQKLKKAQASGTKTKKEMTGEDDD